MSDGFLICPTHGDVLWEPDTIGGAMHYERLRPAHPDLDPGFRVRAGDVVACPICGSTGMRSELRPSVAPA